MYRFPTAFSKFILPLIWGLLFILCLLAPYFPEWVTNIYTQGVFKFGTIGLRILVGWIPFAVGELVYLILIILLIYNILPIVKSFKNSINYSYFWRANLVRMILFGIKLFVVFELIWGLNYVQSDLTKTFQLSLHQPKNAQMALNEMNALTNELIEELNAAKVKLDASTFNQPGFDQIKGAVATAYSKLAIERSYLNLYFPSTKKALFPTLGDYVGYLAFYHPMTGEAIVRADLPILTQPFTIAHEMAHQLGYASETEANFIAYVVAVEQGDPALKYAMLLQMFTYAQEAQLMLIAGNKGYEAFKKQIEINKTLLSPAVLKDRAEIRAFFAARADKQIQASSKLYDQFLKWNQQAAGLASYSDVLKWVNAYRLKTGSSTSYSQ